MAPHKKGVQKKVVPPQHLAVTMLNQTRRVAVEPADAANPNARHAPTGCKARVAPDAPLAKIRKPLLKIWIVGGADHRPLGFDFFRDRAEGIGGGQWHC